MQIPRHLLDLANYGCTFATYVANYPSILTHPGYHLLRHHSRIQLFVSTIPEDSHQNSTEISGPSAFRQMIWDIFVHGWRWVISPKLWDWTKIEQIHWLLASLFFSIPRKVWKDLPEEARKPQKRSGSLLLISIFSHIWCLSAAMKVDQKKSKVLWRLAPSFNGN